MRYLFTFLILSVISCRNTSPEQQQQENTELKTIINRFFDKYEDGSTDEAIDYLFSSNSSFSSEQTQELKNKLGGASVAIGAFTGFEEITEKSTSQSLVFFSYLVKHEKQPLRFNFMFYKPKDQWLLYKFKFDDSVGAELEEAGRIYFIK